MPDRSDNRGNRTSRSSQQMSDRKRRTGASKSGRSNQGGDHNR